MTVTAYLSGPMTGIPQFNYPLFFAAEEYLRNEHKLAVFNPARWAEFKFRVDWRNDDGRNFELRAAMMHYSTVIIQDCDAIVMLHGWANSRGARAEYHTFLGVHGPEMVHFLNHDGASFTLT